MLMYGLAGALEGLGKGIVADNTARLEAAKLQREEMLAKMEMDWKTTQAESERSFRREERVASQQYEAEMQGIKDDKALSTKTAKDASGVERYIATGKPVFEADAATTPGVKPDTVKAESDLRKEYQGIPVVKSFGDIENAYRRVRSSVQNPTPQSDIALVYSFMKMLDPGSVVREGEFATAENSGGISSKWTAIYNGLLKGERLTPEIRAGFLQESEKLFGQATEQLNAENERFGGLASQYGFDPNRIIRPAPTFDAIDPEKMKPQSDRAAQEPQVEAEAPPAPPPGIEKAIWERMWQGFTPEERAIWK